MIEMLTASALNLLPVLAVVFVAVVLWLFVAISMKNVANQRKKESDALVQALVDAEVHRIQMRNAALNAQPKDYQTLRSKVRRND